MDENGRLRIECAWCRREMAAGGNPTTHGICEACLGRVSPRARLLPWPWPTDRKMLAG